MTTHNLMNNSLYNSIPETCMLASHHKEKSWSNSPADNLEVSLTWTIEKFILTYQGKLNGEKIESSKFSAGNNKSIQWSLVLYPRGYDRESNDYISLFLCLLSADRSGGISTEFELGLKNRNGEIVRCRKAVVQQFSENQEAKGYKHFIRLAHLLTSSKNFLCNGDLVVHCWLRYQTDPVAHPCLISAETTQKPATGGSLVPQLEQLFQSGRFADVTFCVSGREFKAHKLLLVSRSPYFASLFEHDMRGRLLDYLEIANVKPEVFEQILRFVYTDNIRDFEAHADDLLIAASKYQLEELKTQCETYLIKTVTAQNCIELLLLADAHGAPHLKRATLSFMGCHIGELINFTSWQFLKHTRPQLIIEMFESSLSKNMRT